MTERPRVEDSRLLAVASTIARGEPVNWTELAPGSDAETATIEQLRVLEGLSQMSDPIPNTWGPFTITGEIGRGAFGTVYRAIDPTLNIEVALKIIRPPEPTTNESGRGLHEARLLAKVNHPNVVRVYRAEQIGPEVGLSMEFVNGRTLRDLIRQHGPLNGNETMLVGLDVCNALAAVHGAGLVHGDIKAANVMRAAGGRIVLMDFGAGDDLRRDTTTTPGPVTGTPLYLAPELFGGGPRTRVGDIYSVGVLLYYLVSGSYPVEGRTGADVERQHETPATRRLLRDVRPDLPDAFINVVDRATAQHPEDRYQTAGELESALKQALRGDTRGPSRVSSPQITWRRGLTATAAVVALGLGYWLWSAAPRTGPDGQPVDTSAGVTAATPGAPATDSYRIEAAFYREEGGGPVLLQPGARVATGDRLSLQVVSSIPTYVFVVNEDDRGDAFLLFPLPGQDLSNPLPAGQRHDIPGVLNGERLTWRVTSAGGREHFLIFASPDPPSPAFDRIFAMLPRPSADVPAVPVSTDLPGELRGVGGLAKAPARPSSTGLTREFGVPLTNAEETVRGVWVRQLTLENPGK